MFWSICFIGGRGIDDENKPWRGGFDFLVKLLKLSFVWQVKIKYHGFKIIFMVNLNFKLMRKTFSDQAMLPFLYKITFS